MNKWEGRSPNDVTYIENLKLKSEQAKTSTNGFDNQNGDEYRSDA